MTEHYDDLAPPPVGTPERPWFRYAIFGVVGRNGEAPTEKKMIRGTESGAPSRDKAEMAAITRCVNIAGVPWTTMRRAGFECRDLDTMGHGVVECYQW